MECAMYVLMSLVILGSMFEIGHESYENSKQTTKIVNYWLPGQYEIVEKVPAGESTYFAQDSEAFKKAFANQKIYVCPDQGGVRYYVNLNGVIYVTSRIDYVGSGDLGTRLVSVRLDQPGQAKFIMERSWLAIIVETVVLGIIMGVIIDVILLIALSALYWMMYWIGRAIISVFRRIGNSSAMSA